MRYLGIDPGQKGGICILGQHGEIIDLFHMPPDYEILANLAADFKKNGGRMALEDVQPSPGWGIKGAWSFAQHIGVLRYLFPDAILVSPRTWQAALTSGVPYRCPKHRALSVAQKRWPLQNWYSKRGKLYDGLVDAALIAEYLRLVEK